MAQDIVNFRQIVAEHMSRIDKLAANTHFMCSNFVANTDLNKFKLEGGTPPSIILVADNPGECESADKVYLCRRGEAGRVAREFFDLACGGESVETGWAMVFNKSSFHTKSTKDLVELIEGKKRNGDLRAVLLRDQEENGKTVSRIAAALNIPVLSIGIDKSNAFDYYKSALIRMARRLGVLHKESFLLNRRLPATFFLSPHFSHFAAFKRCRILGWNQRLSAFVNSYSCTATQKGNPSWRKIRDLGGMELAQEYMFSVLLGAEDPTL